MKVVSNYYVHLFFVWLFLIACKSDRPLKEIQKNEVTDQPAVMSAADLIPEFRKEIKKEPIASYQEKTDNPLNNWYFRVSIFETPKTFHYLLKLQFEEIIGTDTLKLPNFGTLPEPVIHKGPEKYSCIIGFLDIDKKFREYKKVYVKNNVLKITAIKHYSVATYQKIKH
ncbi:MAG: hypothetical protein ACKVOW_14540 [Chitinophagaceae bacterium]